MQKIQTEVLVIGGGATGAGVLRDLAMRGFRSVLVEKGDFSHGTTGRYHGLLHSGGRYVVKDPQAARECIEENRILRKIMPQCIEETGGYFVLTPWDEPAYAPRFLEGCRQAGIPVEEIEIAAMLRREPNLNPAISRCFWVPDGSADSFLASELNIVSARQYNAQALTYHRVLQLLTDSGSSTSGAVKRVTGARVRDLEKNEEIDIYADLVINASGAWAGVIAGTIGVKVHIVPGKGTMLAVNHRIVNTVINRCKMPSDGDILVPAHTVAVIGTTDVKVEDPDHFAIEPWEVQLCLEEGEKIVPGFAQLRVLRAWAGVRPLYQESAVEDTRDVTRAFVLLDHSQRDGVDGLITITSGKWTTYRKMAQETVDLACRKLGVSRPCRTDSEALPAPAAAKQHIHTGFHTLGSRLSAVEDEGLFNELICECELASRSGVEAAITDGKAKTIDDIRRDVRLGMGPCQGGFCTLRAAGMLHSNGRMNAPAANAALRDFVAERWKGLLPILWGQQLRQERLDELIWLSVLNCDHLPGPPHSPLAPTPYQPPAAHAPADLTARSRTVHRRETTSAVKPRFDVLVIGAGLSGLAAAWQALQNGMKVKVITKGWGSTHWQTGSIDVLGYLPGEEPRAVTAPNAAIEELIRRQPDHPYARAGLKPLEKALYAFQALCQKSGYPMHGTLDRNWLLPSSLGAARPTCLAPQTMIAGDLSKDDEMLIVGFRGYYDFFPDLIAENLRLQAQPAQAVTLDLKSIYPRQMLTTRLLAAHFQTPGFIEAFANLLRPHLKSAPRIGLPAVLGYEQAARIHQELEEALQTRVFEIPTLPASIPGIRLHQVLLNEIRRLGGAVYEGIQALGFEHARQHIHSVLTEAAARQKAQHAASFILATGGILGGGIYTTYPASAVEIVFDLPVDLPPDRKDWLQEDFFSPAGHPVYQAGVKVNSRLQPVDAQGNLLYSNLLAAGSLLHGADPLRERSLEGIALANGVFAGATIPALVEA